jgi:hypothetical protein
MTATYIPYNIGVFVLYHQKKTARLFAQTVPGPRVRGYWYPIIRIGEKQRHSQRFAIISFSVIH